MTGGSNCTDHNGISPFGNYIQGICSSRDGRSVGGGDNEVRKYDGQTVTEDRGTSPAMGRGGHG